MFSGKKKMFKIGDTITGKSPLIDLKPSFICFKRGSNCGDFKKEIYCISREENCLIKRGHLDIISLDEFHYITSPINSKYKIKSAKLLLTERCKHV